MLKIYIVYLITASVFTFFLYAVDKRRAKRGEWRISEKALLLAGFFGGGAGALVSMRCFRHKTRRPYFYAVNIAGVLWQTATLAIAVYFKYFG